MFRILIHRSNICISDLFWFHGNARICQHFITLTYCAADYLRTETRKTTIKHSSFSKPEELPGALSQNRGLEHEASPLPADELMLLEVPRLQTDAEGLPSVKLGWFFIWAGHPNVPCKQNMEDVFISLAPDSCHVRTLQRPRSDCTSLSPTGIHQDVILTSPFSSTQSNYPVYPLKLQLNN